MPLPQDARSFDELRVKVVIMRVFGVVGQRHIRLWETRQVA
ncbi:hypothetical protein RM533_11435 [Croceicoccus sp. F390]|uniref:Transposase n=1 Tax=Croceicoccus esteveae TaxID=3075597 RepID=A0ABU2ZJK5_9SPHN|nr:hypothetical protein [Croceicoccus sp. F390]MDT0576785.1 hypothetical protein [Croceicoccus sp. F390]